MFPVIEVQCPYCKATGQIMTPPLGSIIVGPCPRCNEMVLLFDGSVIPLDKDIVTGGSPEEKKQHLLEAIVDVTATKIDELIDSGDLGNKPNGHTPVREAPKSFSTEVAPSVRNEEAPYISRQEVSDFVNIDLHLIDSKDYFDKTFTSDKERE